MASSLSASPSAQGSGGVQNRFRIYFDSFVAPPEIAATIQEEAEEAAAQGGELTATEVGDPGEGEEMMENPDISMAGSTISPPDGVHDDDDDDAETKESEMEEVQVTAEAEQAAMDLPLGMSVSNGEAEKGAVDVTGEEQPKEPQARGDHAPQEEGLPVSLESAAITEDTPGDVSMAGPNDGEIDTSGEGEGPSETAPPPPPPEETPTSAEPASEVEVSVKVESASGTEQGSDVKVEDSIASSTKLQEAAPAAPSDAPDSATAAEEKRKLAEFLKASAANTASAYSTRSKAVVEGVVRPVCYSATRDGEFRRSPSLPPTSTETPLPSPSRLSIVYDQGKRRICLDSRLVERIQVHRGKGVITAQLKLSIKGTQEMRDQTVEDIAQRTEEIDVKAGSGTIDSEITDPPAADADNNTVTDGNAQQQDNEDTAPPPQVSISQTTKPSWSILDGLLLEIHDPSSSTFSQLPLSTLQSLSNPFSSASPDPTLPPLHLLTPGILPSQPIRLVAYLDKEKSLTEAKWVKTGNVEDWIRSGSKVGLPKRGEGEAGEGWGGKIDVMDPDAVSVHCLMHSPVSNGRPVA